jgi:hypothetical protein
MASWSEFEAASREMAGAGRRLLYQFRVGLGYLSTVRPDGGPRIHPFCPIIHAGRIYGLIGRSPKQRDLFRDGRYAAHSFPSPDRDDEFYFTGRAHPRSDAQLVDRVRQTMTSTGATSSGDEALFEFDIERALLAQYKARGEPENWPPRYTKWIDPRLLRK